MFYVFVAYPGHKDSRLHNIVQVLFLSALWAERRTARRIRQLARRTLRLQFGFLPAVYTYAPLFRPNPPHPSGAVSSHTCVIPALDFAGLSLGSSEKWEKGGRWLKAGVVAIGAPQT
ncbi:hypothetical protein HRR82_006501 [Exophiala dermatitidis]|nr:hypothetical protein HRR82_006501 [Exophiala dermatitidis]